MDEINKIAYVDVPPDHNLEIELRFHIDERKKLDSKSKTFNKSTTIAIAKELIKKYYDNPSYVTQSINFISGQRIKQLIFVNGEQQKDKLTHYMKKKVTNDIHLIREDAPACRLAANFELSTDEFSISQANLARIRLRYTIVIDSWQLDITILRNIIDFNNPVKIKTLKNEMLYPLNNKKFADEAPWELSDLIEFELEYIDKNTPFSVEKLTIIDEVLSGTSAETSVTPSNAINASSLTYQSAIYQVAKWLRPGDSDSFQEKDGMKQLSNQVIELDKNMFLKDLLKKITEYYITDKVDGIRTIMYVNNKTCHAISDKLQSFEIDGKASDNVYILDGETYRDGTFYIFDVMIYDNTDISHKPFSERLSYFDKASKLHSTFATKEFVLLTDKFQEQIAKFKKRSVSYETDGIVLTPESGEYRTMQVYKYKPVEKMSVDFLIKKCPNKLLGVAPYMPQTNKTLYLLFCGINSRVMRKFAMKPIRYYSDLFPHIDNRNFPNYMPIQFQPSDFPFAYLHWSSDNNLDNKVGEFVCSQCIEGKVDMEDLNFWKLLHIREDRTVEVERGTYFGNNYRIAELMWMSYKDPLVIEDLDLKSQDDNYFQEHDNQLQKASRNFNSYVKFVLFSRFKNSEWIIDIASGKGQDLFRYNQVECKNVAFLEIDKVALSELINRKHDLGRGDGKKQNNSFTPMNVLIQQLDMNNDYHTNITILENIGLKKESIDVIVCQFAFHYFLATKKNFVNVAQFIKHYLKPGGRFIFTAFDGRDILKILKENNGEWTKKVNDEIQYSIKSEYEEQFLEDFGQQIGVLLPFSKNKYYSEYLVNLLSIEREFIKLGFTLESDQSFSEFFDGYKKNNMLGYNSLTDVDKQYVSLYHAYCFYKTKK